MSVESSGDGAISMYGAKAGYMKVESRKRVYRASYMRLYVLSVRVGIRNGRVAAAVRPPCHRADLLEFRSRKWEILS